jgi:hypothetical protein
VAAGCSAASFPERSMTIAHVFAHALARTVRLPHRRARGRVLSPLAAVSLAAAMGCSDAISSASEGGDAPGQERACTLIGCVDGLTVQLPSAPSGAWRVEVTDLAAGGAPRVFECAAGATCSPSVFFADLAPERARVRVVTTRGTVESEVRPTYAAARPNGEDCPPVCRQARVEVTLPA